MDEDCPIGVESNYKKRQQEKLERLTKLASGHKNNKVLQEMKEKHEQMLKPKKLGELDMLHDIIWTAEDMYREGEITKDQAIDQICEAMQACKGMDKKN